jgi:Uncharacterised nucleotidyltransferase
MTLRRPTGTADRIFLRACSVQSADDWVGQGPALRRLDAAAWDRVATLTRRHGMTCLIARNLAWTQQACGLAAPIQATLDAARGRRTLTQMTHKAAARQVTEALAAAGVRFVLLRGFALSEEVYGDISLRGFGDCDILVEPDAVGGAHAILSSLRYRGPSLGDIDARMRSGFSATEFLRTDRTSVDLHWALCDEIFLDQNALVWSHVCPPEGAGRLPGLRLSPELALVQMAMHFHHHEFVKVKALVDFYVIATRLADRIDPDVVARLARAFAVTDVVDLAARLCDRHFVPHPAIARLVRPGASPRVRLAARLLGRRALLRTRGGPISDWLRVTRRWILAGSYLSREEGFRRLYLPRPAELADRFGRPYVPTMYASYYRRQIMRVLTRSSKPFRESGL